MALVPHWMDGVPFTNAQGREAGLTDAVMRRRAFERPFHGVRVVGSAGRIDQGFIDRCAQLRVVMPRDFVFSHATAARLWGVPLPRWLDPVLHVSSPRDAYMRRPGVLGWRSETGATDIRFGLPVMAPSDTWTSLATMTERRGGRMPRHWLVATADFLVSGPRLRFGRGQPLAALAELEEARLRRGSGRGAAALAWALPRVRRPVDSPRETFLRLGLVQEGLSEPAVQPPVETRVGIRHPDLGYLEQGLLIEYLGDVHRTDPATWRQDLLRVQLFEDAGYRVILTGADDLTAEGIRALAARVQRALSR
jgi:hypothetical protein